MTSPARGRLFGSPTRPLHVRLSVRRMLEPFSFEPSIERGHLSMARLEVYWFAAHSPELAWAGPGRPGTGDMRT